jgi:polygalacturonase
MWTRRRVIQAAGAAMFMGPATQWMYAGTLDVRNNGAHGDGVRPDTDAINRAIHKVSSRGGGTVYLPAGTYLCGSIQLLSHVRFYLERGAVLKAIATNTAYDEAEPNPHDAFQDFGHSHWKNSLIWAIGESNIAIEGGGLVDGQALTADSRKRIADKAIGLKLCRGVVLRDFSMLRCGHFAVLATGVDDLTIDNLKVDTNRDGINIDACRNTRISNCLVNSPLDDAIVVKSTYALGTIRDTEQLTIIGCQVSGYDVGSVLDGSYSYRPDPRKRTPTGRIKLGTESTGSFRNIVIADCTFDHCRGLAIETVDGGTLENLTATGLTMRHLTNSPLFLRLGRRQEGGPNGPAAGKLRRIHIENVIATEVASPYASVFSGIPGHDMEDISLRNIYVSTLGGGTAADASRRLDESETAKPEADMFGVTPSYGFYLRHIRGLQMSDVRLHCDSQDARPAIAVVDAQGIDLRGMRAEPYGLDLACERVKNLTVRDCGALPDKDIPYVDALTLRGAAVS